MNPDTNRTILIYIYDNLGPFASFMFGSWLYPELKVITSGEEMVVVMFGAVARLPKSIRLVKAFLIILVPSFMIVIMGICGWIYLPSKWFTRNPLYYMSIGVVVFVFLYLLSSFITILIFYRRTRIDIRIILNELGYAICEHCGTSLSDVKFHESSINECPECGSPIPPSIKRSILHCAAADTEVEGEGDKGS